MAMESGYCSGCCTCGRDRFILALRGPRLQIKCAYCCAEITIPVAPEEMAVLDSRLFPHYELHR